MPKRGRSVLVFRRFLRTLDRVSIGRHFLSFQPHPKLFLNSRDERLLRQSARRPLDSARNRCSWIPIYVETVTSLQSGPVDHRPAQVHAEELGQNRDLDPLRTNLPPPNLEQPASPRIGGKGHLVALLCNCQNIPCRWVCLSLECQMKARDKPICRVCSDSCKEGPQDDPCHRSGGSPVAPGWAVGDSCGGGRDLDSGPVPQRALARDGGRPDQTGGMLQFPRKLESRSTCSERCRVVCERTA